MTVEKSIFPEHLSEVIQMQRWIIDNNYGSTMEEARCQSKKQKLRSLQPMPPLFPAAGYSTGFLAPEPCCWQEKAA